MRLATITHIEERMQHAAATHGHFASPWHAVKAARIEIMEAELAISYEGMDRAALEMLDAAVVLIRAAEQYQKQPQPQGETK